MNKNYDDIIDLTYPTPSKRRKMSMYERAAQFAPFAALVGYDDAVEETARLTNEKISLDEYEIERLNDRLVVMSENPDEIYTVTYFVPDKKKSGGTYNKASGSLRSIDEYHQSLIMSDGKIIPINDIYNVESEIFLEF